MKKVLNGLYADKNLDVLLTSDKVIKAQSINGNKVVYFWDGNNGDRHLIVGHTTDLKGNINTVLAINLGQSYLDGSYNSFSNANKAAESLKMPKNGSELVSMFNQIKVFTI